MVHWRQVSICVLSVVWYCSSRIGIIQTHQHCALVYLRAVDPGKERLNTSHSREKSTSLGYKSHQTAQGTAANGALAATSNEPLSLCCPSPICESGEHVDANALRALAACPSGGRNCPRVSLAIPCLNCPITSLKAHLCARSRGFTRQCKAYALLHVAY